MTTIAEAAGAREKVEPDIVTSGAPGAMVCEPTTKFDALSAVMTWDPSVITGWPVNAPAIMAPSPEDEGFAACGFDCGEEPS